MTKVTVAWFDQFKGFGEGVSESGEKVFLSHLAIDAAPNQFKGLIKGEVVECTLSKRNDRTVAISISRSTAN